MTEQKVVTAEGMDMAAGSSDLQVPILHGDDQVLYSSSRGLAACLVQQNYVFNLHSLSSVSENNSKNITIFNILNQGESDTALSLILKRPAG